MADIIENRVDFDSTCSGEACQFGGGQKFICVIFSRYRPFLSTGVRESPRSSRVFRACVYVLTQHMSLASSHSGPDEDALTKPTRSEIPIGVYVRLRPLESTETHAENLRYNDHSITGNLHDYFQFDFRKNHVVFVVLTCSTGDDHVFSPSVSNIEVYERVAHPVVQRFLTGCHGNVVRHSSFSDRNRLYLYVWTHWNREIIHDVRIGIRTGNYSACTHRDLCCNKGKGTFLTQLMVCL